MGEGESGKEGRTLLPYWVSASNRGNAWRGAAEASDYPTTHPERRRKGKKGPHPLNSLYPEKVSFPAFKFSSYSDPPHPREDTPRARQKYSTKCLPTQEKKDIQSVLSSHLLDGKRPFCPGDKSEEGNFGARRRRLLRVHF